MMKYNGWHWQAPRGIADTPRGCDTARAMAMVTRYVMFYQA